MLGVRRLSIIDLAGGGQPLHNEDRSVAVVANGEIYNFVELRADLEAKGHRFATGSDCETIVHLYEDHGLDFVHHLRGMFAIALWDLPRRRLVLARDRMGEKPLYLCERDGTLFFASELKAILRSGAVAPELDPVAIDLFFHYAWVPEPLTPVRGVRKLDAGHLVVIDVDPWRVEDRCYWRMEDAAPLDEDPVAAIRAQLEVVGRLVVRSDVPVGVALSGGLDSSAVAALAVRAYPGTVHAFSIGYPGRPACDERDDASALARLLGIPFHDLELRTEDMVAEFPDTVYWRDDPIADVSGYGYYSVMRLARAHGVPVLLEGQGGDELFWYSDVLKWLRQTKRAGTLAQRGATMLPALLRESLPEGFGAREWYRWLRGGAGWAEARTELREALRRPAGQTAFFSLERGFRQARTKMHGYYGAGFRRALGNHDPAGLFSTTRSDAPLEVLFTAWICASYLRENGIAQSDRLGMASSVELRLPFLDHRLVETVVGLRKARPDAHLPAKSLLKAAVADILPPSVLARPKRGFAAPTREWYRELFRRYGDTLPDGRLVANGVLEPDGAREFARGVAHPLSFRALVLEQWMRRVLEGSS
jgi:asparagine synthase (glutamine-hydrolysing)